LIHGDYRLIVTSPGIEKPLEQDYEFKRNIGKKLAVNYITETQESMEIVGELIRYDGENIGLKVGKNEVNIAVNKIKKAKIKLKW
jgi:ribosome maturation factor RimP